MDSEKIYREKYIKYKNKYNELKNSRQQLGGGFFSKLQSAVGLDSEADKKNNKIIMEVKKLFESSLKEVEPTLKLYENNDKLTSAEESQILKDFKEITGYNYVVSTGKIPAAINKIKVFEMKKDSEGKKELVTFEGQDDSLKAVNRLDIICNDARVMGLNTLSDLGVMISTTEEDFIDMFKTWTEKLLKKQLDLVHGKLMNNPIVDQLSKEMFGESSIENVHKLNQQIALNKECKTKEIKLDSCDEENIKQFNSAFKDITLIKKSVEPVKYQLNQVEASLKKLSNVLKTFNVELNTSDVSFDEIKKEVQDKNDMLYNEVIKKYDLETEPGEFKSAGQLAAAFSKKIRSESETKELNIKQDGGELPDLLTETPENIL